jgi:hypothetical protein
VARLLRLRLLACCCCWRAAALLRLRLRLLWLLWLLLLRLRLLWLFEATAAFVVVAAAAAVRPAPVVGCAALPSLPVRGAARGAARRGGPARRLRSAVQPGVRPRGHMVGTAVSAAPLR